MADFNTLGNSGLRVSPLTIGTMTFGEDWGWGADEATSHDLLNQYIERGGNSIDTANGYTKGHSEVILGNWFQANPGKRDRVVLATKFFQGMYRGDPNGGGAGRKAIVAQLHESLRRLQTDYIDLYWMHAWDPFTPIAETLRTLNDLVSAGKIRYIGFSDTPAWKVAQAQGIAERNGWAPVTAIQIEYSLRQRTVEADLIPMADELGIGVVPWSPLSGGILTGKYRRGGSGDSTGRNAGAEDRLTDKDVAILDVLDTIAGETGATVAEVALAWVRQKPGVDTTIIGVRTQNQLDSNVGSLNVSLDDGQMQRLDEVSAPELPFPQNALDLMWSFGGAGTTIDGVPSEVNPNSPEGDDDRW